MFVYFVKTQMELCFLRRFLKIIFCLAIQLSLQFISDEIFFFVSFFVEN